MLRCAKTLKKQHIGILYERYSRNPDDTTIIQGLVGRNTCYDNNGISICYTNIDSIIRYETLWQSNFENKTIKWNSKTTKYVNGILSGENTFNDPKDYDGFSIASEADDESETPEPIIRKFKTQEEAKEYYLKELKPKFGGRGPNNHPGPENGFYIDTNVKYVLSTNDLYNKRKDWLKNQKRPYRLRPCYENTTDPSTLQWWLIHY